MLGGLINSTIVHSSMSGATMPEPYVITKPDKTDELWTSGMVQIESA